MHRSPSRWCCTDDWWAWEIVSAHPPKPPLCRVGACVCVALWLAVSAVCGVVWWIYPPLWAGTFDRQQVTPCAKQMPHQHRYALCATATGHAQRVSTSGHHRGVSGVLSARQGRDFGVSAPLAPWLADQLGQNLNHRIIHHRPIQLVHLTVGYGNTAICPVF